MDWNSDWLRANGDGMIIVSNVGTRIWIPTNQEKPVSRWPLAGPSEYWLIASSPTSKKKDSKKENSNYDYKQEGEYRYWNKSGSSVPFRFHLFSRQLSDLRMKHKRHIFDLPPPPQKKISLTNIWRFKLQRHVDSTVHLRLTNDFN